MKSSIKEEFYKYLKDPVTQEDKLVACLEKLRQNWQQYRQNEHDHKWRQNLNFYAGQHYVRDTGRNANQYRVKLRENHTNNVINRMVSIFVQNMPVTRVFPATDAYEDVQDSETCESYLKYFWREKQLEIKYAKLVKYASIFGNAFTFTQYDPYAGGVMNISEEESKDSLGEEKQTKPYRGDVKVDVDDPFRILVRPGIEELNDMFDFFRSVPSNKQELESIYGEIETQPVNALNAYNGTLRTDDDITLVHHYYHKPTYWWEKGCYICYAGKKILKATEYPNKSGRLMLTHLPFDKPPMKFWALSTIDQIIDLQEQLNRAASMIIEARNLIARPRVLVSEEAKVPGQTFTDRPGDIVKYKMIGGKPDFFVPNFNFAELANHKADVRNALQLVSGITSASRGEIPSATKTALALQLVLEQDRSQWAPFIKQFYMVIKETSLNILETAAQNFTEDDPRVIKIEQNNIIGTKTFHGGLVPSSLDVWLEDTNPLGWTATGRIEAAQGLYQAGLITDKNQVLEMLQLNNSDPAYQFQHISRQTARKENELLNNGEFVKVESEDYDPIHMEEHMKEMVSFNYKYKATIVKEAFQTHVDEHKARMQSIAPPQVAGAPNVAQDALNPLAQTVGNPQPGDQLQQLMESSRSG
jgi:hypothetical protein